MSSSPRYGVALTDVQRSALQLAAGGCSNAQVARRLYRTEDTIKTQLHRAYVKLGARNRAHAVALAARRGLIDLDRVVDRHAADRGSSHEGEGTNDDDDE